MYNKEFFDDFVSLQQHAGYIDSADSTLMHPGNIDDQNFRYGRVNEIDDSEFQAVAVNGLVEEQVDLLTDLKTASEALPYEELHSEHSQLLQQHDEVKHRLDTITDQEDAEKTRVLEMARLVTELAPRSKEAVTELAEKRLKQVDELNRKGLEERLSTLKEEIQASEEAFTAIGQAWTLPQTPYHSALAPTVITEEHIYIDELPVEPEIPEGTCERLRRIRERHIDAPEASQYITAYLADHVGRSVTVDELGEFLYSDEASLRAGAHGIRSRITTMLGPKIQGHRINRMLGDEGFSLQYGWRKHYTLLASDKKRFDSKHRIYRAVAIDSADAGSEYVEEQVVLQNGETSQIQERASLNDLASTAGQISVGAVLEKENGHGHDAEVVLGTEVNNDGQHSSTVEAKGKAAGESSKLPWRRSRKDAAAEQKGDWTKELQKTVGESIQKLHEEGLMSEDPISRTAVRTKSSSRTLATDTSISRLVSARVFTPQQAIAKTFAATEIVLMAVYNGNKDVFTSSARRKRAVEIVNDCVEKYFEHQKPDEQ